MATTTIYPGADGEGRGGIMVPRVTFPERLEKDISNILIKNSDRVLIQEIGETRYCVKDLEGIMFELLDYITKNYEAIKKAPGASN